MGILIGLILVIIVGVCIMGVLYMIGVYNQLLAAKKNAETAFGNIDVILKQRHDEIPKLVKVCKGYMKYEADILTKITELRTSVMGATKASEQTGLENQLSSALKSLFAVAENYPELKANQNFIQLQTRVTGLEMSLSEHRETYNNNANIYNIRIKQIPDVFIARPLGWTQKEMYEVAEEDKKDVEINL